MNIYLRNEFSATLRGIDVGANPPETEIYDDTLIFYNDIRFILIIFDITIVSPASVYLEMTTSTREEIEADTAIWYTYNYGEGDPIEVTTELELNAPTAIRIKNVSENSFYYAIRPNR
jgi:hypothetical protein